jgi:hypothetical protein
MVCLLSVWFAFDLIDRRVVGAAVLKETVDSCHRRHARLRQNPETPTEPEDRGQRDEEMMIASSLIHPEKNQNFFIEG